MTPIEAQPDGLVLRRIQDAYISGRIRKSKVCMSDMTRTGIFEVDIERVIMDAALIERKECNPSNFQYVIHGTSTKGAEVFCGIAGKCHPENSDSVYWALTSFENK